jgi:hypothetical protein
MSAKRKYESQIGITDLENPIKKNKKAPTRFSSWFITIACNIFFKDPKDPNLPLVAQALKETLDDLLSDEEEFQSILLINKRVVNRNIDNSLSK